MNESPFTIYGDARDLTVPLRPTFRFVHEPLGRSQSATFVGRQNEIESLAERILFSDGGSFLVTGYRGVGKTSFVNQVIRKLGEDLPRAEPLIGETRIVDIYLNIARPVAPSEMMHYIIRCVYDRLIELGIHDHLDPTLRSALSLAYSRTSVNMARKLSESTERTIGIAEAGISGSWLGAFLKATVSSKRTRTNDYEMSFLGYDDKAAEHDVIGISRRLANGYETPMSRWTRFWHEGPAPRVRLKIVLVFDELDKLEEFAPKATNGDGPPRPAIDDIIGGLKNLFTTSGVTFIFVAGKDLHERWLEDVGRGDSVYESVFAYDKYLPCLWADVADICDSLVDRSTPFEAYHDQIFDRFKKYLMYRGRGIPRRIIRTFNEYVEWEGERPALRFTPRDVRRVRFFAGLQALLEDHESELFGEPHEEASGTQTDKRRLGVYYLIDWILRQGTTPFTLKDVLSASRRLSVKIALAEEIAPRVAEDIIGVLNRADYIQSAQRGITQVVIGVANGEEQVRYRVVPRRLVEMGGQSDGAEVDAVLGVAPAGGSRGMPAAIQRFRIIREIGRGGMGVVYEALDERFGVRAAVKVMAETLAHDPSVAGRFEREARILKALEHPNIVRLIDWGHDDGRPFIAMEYLDGITLEEVIRRRGRLALDVAYGIIRPVADALGYVHQRGFVRNDIKPNNIILTTTGRVFLLDFGISRPRAAHPTIEAETRTGSFILIGTPHFMAPEQFSSNAADERSDVYALGVVLYRTLTGAYPFEGSGVFALMQAHVGQRPEPPSRHAPLPAAVDTLILRCLAKNPDERFQSVVEVADALAAVVGPREPVNLAALVGDVRALAREVDAMDQARTGADVGTMRTQMAPRAQPSDPPSDMIPAAPAKGGWFPSPLPPPPRPRTAPQPPQSIPPAPIADPSRTAASPGPVPARPHRLSPFLPTPKSSPTIPGVYEPPPTFVRTVRRNTSKPVLILVGGDADRVVATLGEPIDEVVLDRRITIGRSSDNDVVLRNPKVSRYHAFIDSEGGQSFIEDANSNIGTFVRGERVLERRQLAHEDYIQIGEFTFRFERGASR